MTMFNKFINKLQDVGFLAVNQEREIEFNFSSDDVGTYNEFHNIESYDDLPKYGLKGTKYRVLDTGDLYTWTDGKFKVYNPYSFGITQQYHEPQPVNLGNTVVKDENGKLVLEDERQLASISIGQIRSGGDARLAVGFNIHALRKDLALIKSLNMSFESMVDRSKWMSDRSLISNWFYQNHTALSLLLRSTVKGPNNIDLNMLDGVHNSNCHVYWDKSIGSAIFKINELVIKL